MGAWHPFLNLHGSVADIGCRIDGPCLPVGLHSRLLNRAQRGIGADLVKVYARMGQLYYKGLIVRSGYCQCVQISGSRLVVALNHAQKIIAIGSRCHRIRHSLKGIDKIIGCERRSIAPLQALAQMEGVGQTILGNVPGLRHSADDIVVLVHVQQRLKQMDNHDVSIAGAV